MPLNTNFKILPTVWNDIKFSESKIGAVKFSETHNSGTNSFESCLIHRFEPNRIVYDLYKYEGVTYTNNEDGAIPAANFDVNEEGTAWTFNLPIWGYKVLNGEEPPDVGPYSWKYITSIVIIKDRLIFKDLPEDYLKKAKVVNYLFTDNNVPLPNFHIMLDPINEIYTEFAYFYRWIKVDNGFTLEYYAIYPYTAEPEVKLQLMVYFLNKDLGNESQSFKV